LQRPDFSMTSITNVIIYVAPSTFFESEDYL